MQTFLMDLFQNSLERDKFLLKVEVPLKMFCVWNLVLKHFSALWLFKGLNLSLYG